MSHWAEYDYDVINRDLNRSIVEVRSILAAERSSASDRLD